MSEKVQLLLDGVKLMVMGMVAVYVFLVLMVFLMNLLSKLLAPLGKAGFLEPAAPVKKAPAKKAAGNDAALAAAAVAAVKAHTSK
ncbi:MAG: oxaloacetate decarboxylase [Lentisphaerae bacterium]|nr:oxaloacetate decarboxylase [Lentisphaerota bacterium]